LKVGRKAAELNKPLFVEYICGEGSSVADVEPSSISHRYDQGPAFVILVKLMVADGYV
jgi:hypothetical protein